MEELIACKYEDILNRRKALCMEILTSEKNDKSLENMLKETISIRRELEKIKSDYDLRKRKIITTISNPTIQKLMDEYNNKYPESEYSSTQRKEKRRERIL